MKTLFDLYRWQIIVLVCCLYIIWEKGGWVKAIYEAKAESQPFIQAVVLAVVAVIAGAHIALTLWKEAQDSKTRK